MAAVVAILSSLDVSPCESVASPPISAISGLPKYISISGCNASTNKVVPAVILSVDIELVMSQISSIWVN